MKFLHTSDWQIGMKAESVGNHAGHVREERLEAAKRVVQAARDHGAELIVVTGDTFEDNAVDRLLVRRVGEILRSFPGPVYLIPGNHDPLVPGSVWEHGVWAEAANLTLLGASEPVELDACILYPCPLREKYSTRNPTSWINAKDAAKPAIGLAHGNVEGMLNGEQDYPIPRDAAARLGLDYLALGHWHSYSRYDGPDGVCRMAYAGTHETTKFGERDSGNAVIVEIAGRVAPPKLTPVKTGRLDWRTLERTVDQPQSLEPLIAELGQIAPAETALVRVLLRGVLFPDDRAAVRRIGELLGTRFLFGMLDASGLIPAPDGAGWIETLPPGPFREAAAKLHFQAADRKSTRLNSSHSQQSRMPSSA